MPNVRYYADGIDVTPDEFKALYDGLVEWHDGESNIVTKVEPDVSNGTAEVWMQKASVGRGSVQPALNDLENAINNLPVDLPLEDENFNWG